MPETTQFAHTIDLLRKVERIKGEIRRKQAAADKLLDKLTGSLKIRAIWPEAFKDGQTCSTGGIGKPRKSHKVGDWHHMKSAYLKRADGEIFIITEEQFNAIRAPGATKPPTRRKNP